MPQFAVMNIEKGEEIISALVSGHIAGTGRYKFLTKKRKDKKIEWPHFVERESKERNKRNLGCLKIIFVTLFRFSICFY